MSLAETSFERVNVLLVDDRPSNLLSLEAALSRPDYQLLLARSAAAIVASVYRRSCANSGSAGVMSGMPRS